MNSDRIVASQLTTAQYKAWLKTCNRLGLSSSELLRHYANLNMRLEQRDGE